MCKTHSFSSWLWFMRVKSFLLSKICFLFILYEWWRIYQLFAVLVCCETKNYCISTSKIPFLTHNLVQNQIDLFLASMRNMKWLGNIKKRNAGKTQICVFRGLRVKMVEVKLEALTGWVLQSAFNNFAQFTAKHLCWSLFLQLYQEQNSGTGVFV